MKPGWLIVFLPLLISGCGGDSDSEAPPGAPPVYGWMQSSDMDVLPVDVPLRAYFSFGCASPFSDFLAATNIRPPAETYPFPVKGDWAIRIDTLGDGSEPGHPIFENGDYLYSDLEARLYKNYEINAGYSDTSCLEGTADGSWLAVGGYVKVIDEYRHWEFDLHFQQETAFNSGITAGPITGVAGCVHSAEGAANECLPAPK